MNKIYKSLLLAIIATSTSIFSQFMNPDFDAAIVFDGETTELDPAIKTFAQSVNNHFDQSIFFDTTYLRDKEIMRTYCSQDDRDPAEFITIETDDGHHLTCTYFHRDDIYPILIVGGGYRNNRENFMQIKAMFRNHNILFFDPRGHGYDPDAWNIFSTKRFLGINFSAVTFGKEEYLDIFAVVDYCRTQHEDVEIHGLFFCFSAYNVVIAQAMRERQEEILFDKLVLDGCWQSLESFVDKIAHDPKLLIDGQRGGWKDAWFMKNGCTGPLIKNTIMSLSEKIWGFDIDLLDYLPNITSIPVLFFHAKQDIYVPFNEMQDMLDALGTNNKALIALDARHVRNHISHTKLYQVLSELFFDLPFDEFKVTVNSIHGIRSHYSQKLYSY